VDPTICREHLSELLSEEAGLLQELVELLERERAIIESKDSQALQRTTAERQKRIGALARIEEQRHSVCRMHGHSPDRAGLERLIAWCDPAGAILSCLRRSTQLAQRCRDLNDRNGILVTARLRSVEGQLAVLTGRTQRPETYGPRGYVGLSRPKLVLGAA
jgi:flagellar biosynthesis/type III secretory pathway chaperone